MAKQSESCSKPHRSQVPGSQDALSAFVRALSETTVTLRTLCGKYSKWGLGSCHRVGRSIEWETSRPWNDLLVMCVTCCLPCQHEESLQQRYWSLFTPKDLISGCYLLVYVGNECAWCLLRSEEDTRSLKLESEMVVRCHVGAGNRTVSSARAKLSALKHQAISLVPIAVFLLNCFISGPRTPLDESTIHICWMNTLKYMFVILLDDTNTEINFSKLKYLNA